MVWVKRKLENRFERRNLEETWNPKRTQLKRERKRPADLARAQCKEPTPASGSLRSACDLSAWPVDTPGCRQKAAI